MTNEGEEPGIRDNGKINPPANRGKARDQFLQLDRENGSEAGQYPGRWRKTRDLREDRLCVWGSYTPQALDWSKTSVDALVSVDREKKGEEGENRDHLTD